MFSHIHQSGRYDASLAEFQAMLAANTARASVLTITETQTDYMVPAMREVPGWTAVAAKANLPGQCSIMWDKSVWEHVSAWHRPISSGRWFTGSGAHHTPLAVPVVLLRHKARGRIFAFTVAHMPSHVEGRHRLGGPRNRRVAWLQGVAGLRRLRRRLRGTNRSVTVVVAADTNLDMRRAWCRAAWAVVGGRLTWRRGPRGWANHPGTHGARLIDACRVSGPSHFSASQVLPSLAGFDHRPFRTRFYF